jgi:hypothetical protein
VVSLLKSAPLPRKSSTTGLVEARPANGTPATAIGHNDDVVPKHTTIDGKLGQSERRSVVVAGG